MSRVIILLCSLIWILFSSCAISYEFLVVYANGTHIKLFSFLLRYMAILYDGARVLVTTGLIGSFPLCVFLCMH
jgi:hypothetical protein